MAIKFSCLYCQYNYTNNLRSCMCVQTKKKLIKEKQTKKEKYIFNNKAN